MQAKCPAPSLPTNYLNLTFSTVLASHQTYTTVLKTHFTLNQSFNKAGQAVL